MFDQKIIDAMRRQAAEPLPPSTRAALWQIRDTALERHYASTGSHALIPGIALTAQKTSLGWPSGLLAGALLIGTLLAGNQLLTPSNGQANLSANTLDCLTCQLDKVCRL